MSSPKKSPAPRVSQDPHNQRSLRDNICSVFYPGVFASRQQGSKYAGEEGIPVFERNGDGSIPECASRKQWFVKSKHAPRILHNIVPLPEVRENGVGFTCNPFYWPQMAASVVVHKFFRNAGGRPFYSRFLDLSIGGTKDQAACQEDVGLGIEALKARTETKSEKQHLVMFGNSRGATTTLHAALRLPKDMAEQVSLVIVEAPFNNLKSVMEDSSWMPSVNLALMKNFAHYTPEAYEMPDETHLKCPIAFVTSVLDERVPDSQTKAVMERVKVRFPHLELIHLELHSSHHGLMPYGCLDDQERYLAFVEELYDKHCPSQ